MPKRLVLAAVGLAALAPGSAVAAAPNVVFRTVPVATTGDYFTGIRAADLNGDGRTDIVTSDADGNVHLFLARGAARFRKPVTYRLGRELGSLEVANLNRDKHLDIIVAVPDVLTDSATSGGGIFVLYGTRSGSFAAPRLVETGQSSTAPAVGDVNHDGLVDVVVANGGVTAYPGRVAGEGITVLIQRGDGQFVIQPATDLASAATLALGDLNGDRVPELITGSILGLISGGLSVYPGTSSGGFGPRTDYPIAEADDLAAAQVVDLNTDSRPDVVASTFSGITTFLGLGDGRLREVQYLRSREFAGLGGRALVTGDFNRDGHIDVVTTIADHAFVMLGRGSGHLAAPVRYPSPIPNAAIADGGDFNGDGRQDFVVAGDPGRAAVQLNLRTVARAQPVLPARRTPLIDGDHSVRVPVACTHGAAPCYGTLVIRRDGGREGAAAFDIAPGQRQLVRVIVAAGRAGMRLAASAATDAGVARRTITLARPSPAERRRACYPRGAEEILRNGTMRVFRPPGGSSLILTGCLFKFGDWVSFGTFGASAPTYGPFAARGALIAYLGEEDCGYDTCIDRIHVFDVAGNQARFQEPLHAPCTAATPCPTAYVVGDLVIGRGGAIAWSLCLIARGTSEPGTCRARNAHARVWMLDGRGARLVDDAARIAPTSLASTRDGSGFTWRRAGRTHSAAFVGAPPLQSDRMAGCTSLRRRRGVVCGAGDS